MRIRSAVLLALALLAGGPPARAEPAANIDCGALVLSAVLSATPSLTDPDHRCVALHVPTTGETLAVGWTPGAAARVRIRVWAGNDIGDVLLVDSDCRIIAGVPQCDNNINAPASFTQYFNPQANGAYGQEQLLIYIAGAPMSIEVMIGRAREELWGMPLVVPRIEAGAASVHVAGHYSECC